MGHEDDIALVTMEKKTTLKVKDGKVYNEGRVYTAKIDELVGDIFLGGRLTDCCESFSTIDDGPLYCKKCYYDVEWGEGDGSENLADDYKVKWNISKKTGKVTSCKIVEMSDVEIQEKIKLNNAKYGAYIKIGVGS